MSKVNTSQIQTTAAKKTTLVIPIQFESKSNKKTSRKKLTKSNEKKGVVPPKSIQRKKQKTDGN